MYTAASNTSNEQPLAGQAVARTGSSARFDHDWSDVGRQHVFGDRIIETKHFVSRCVPGPDMERERHTEYGLPRPCCAVAGNCRAAAARPGKRGLTLSVRKGLWHAGAAVYGLRGS